jgi:hypothetical protein
MKKIHLKFWNSDLELRILNNPQSKITNPNNFYALLSASTPGNNFPSKNSREAPPPVET